MDLKQIELCVAALLSGEPALINPINAGDDLHTLRAIENLGLPFLTSKYPILAGAAPRTWKDLCKAFDELERQTFKQVNFADLFRAGWEKIRSTVYDWTGIWIDPALFQRVVRNRPTDRPVLWAWQEGLIADARRDGFLSLPFTGQSRSFLGGTKFDVSEIVNFPVQATASNVMLRLQHFFSVHLDPLSFQTRLHRTHLCSNTYDALLFDCTTPSSLSSLKALIPQALTWITTEDYWAHLQSLYGRTVRIACSTKETPHDH